MSLMNVYKSILPSANRLSRRRIISSKVFFDATYYSSSFEIGSAGETQFFRSKFAPTLSDYVKNDFMPVRLF
jgi:hypothetical protein